MLYTITVPALAFVIEVDNPNDVWNEAVYAVADAIEISPDPSEGEN